MEIASAFDVASPPDRVFAFLLDVNQVVGCMPGAELSEVVDADTFKGRVKIKVGPITVSYNGVARIASRDEATRSATIEAEGRETTGPGSARATATMQVAEAGAASKVTISAEYSVAGRVAQFGRGVMEDVARRLIGQMADCIKERLESGGPAQPAGVSEPDRASGAVGTKDPGAISPPGGAQPQAQAAKPVNALGLLFSVLWARVRSLFGRRAAV